ncbi:hypothetical protein LTR16_010347, partial [Cryomyces antarcticus]
HHNTSSHSWPSSRTQDVHHGGHAHQRWPGLRHRRDLPPSPPRRPRYDHARRRNRSTCSVARRIESQHHLRDAGLAVNKHGDAEKSYTKPNIPLRRNRPLPAVPDHHPAAARPARTRRRLRRRTAAPALQRPPLRRARQSQQREDRGFRPKLRPRRRDRAHKRRLARRRCPAEERGRERRRQRQHPLPRHLRAVRHVAGGRG